MSRNQMTFYSSFWDAANILPEESRYDFLQAIFRYVFEDYDSSKDLSGPAAATFVLVRPVLDAANRKAEIGRLGGSKRKALTKQEESKGENKVEVEVEVENKDEKKVEGKVAQADILSPILSLYGGRITPPLSANQAAELLALAHDMGMDCCSRAADIALAKGKASWPYIIAILRTKQSQGVRCLADWDKLETRSRIKNVDYSHSEEESL